MHLDLFVILFVPSLALALLCPVIPLVVMPSAIRPPLPSLTCPLPLIFCPSPIRPRPPPLLSHRDLKGVGVAHMAAKSIQLIQKSLELATGIILFLSSAYSV